MGLSFSGRTTLSRSENIGSNPFSPTMITEEQRLAKNKKISETMKGVPRPRMKGICYIPIEARRRGGITTTNILRERKAKWGKEKLDNLLFLDFDNITKEEKRLRVIQEQNGDCNICGTSDWLGKILVLHVHHKDGNKKNDKHDNLEGLCPNCHSQTPNYGNTGV